MRSEEGDPTERAIIIPYVGHDVEIRRTAVDGKMAPF